MATLVGASILAVANSRAWVGRAKALDPSTEHLHPAPADQRAPEGPKICANDSFVKQERARIHKRLLHDQHMLRAKETCGAVISTQEMKGVSTVRSLLPLRCALYVYDKADDGTRACFNGTGRALPANTKCFVSPNYGREFESYLRHVANNYDSLPDRLIMTTGVFARHDRLTHFHNLVLSTVLSESKPPSFWCVRRMRACEDFWDKPHQNLSQYHDYGMLEYLGSRPSPATSRPQGVFVRERIQPHQPEACLRTCATGVCHYGILATTRELLRSHPRAVYESMLQEFPTHSMSPEAGFFLEMIAELAFGYRANVPDADYTSPSCSRDCSSVKPNTVSRYGNVAYDPDPRGADPFGSRTEALWPRSD